MKKSVLFSFLAVILVATACNNNAEKKDNPLKAQADSLYKEVMEGHDIAMPKSMRIPKLQKAAQHMIDSIAALPEKLRLGAAPLKTKLEELLNELGNADNAMNTWMSEIDFDSAANNLEQRIKYFTEEKIKVGKVKEVVLNSVAKADSLLKAKL